MKKNLLIAVWFTLITTLLFGVAYPFAVTGLAHLLFPGRADGQLIKKNGKLIGSRIIGQEFTGPDYFHSRPSAAGAGYNPLDSGGSDLAPTNKVLIARVEARVKKLHAENPGTPIPIDLVTASGSGLDPDISPAAAEFQVPRVARARGISRQALQSLVRKHVKGRQFGFLGEPRVNVLELNLALDRRFPPRRASRPRARAAKAPSPATRSGTPPRAR